MFSPTRLPSLSYSPTKTLGQEKPRLDYHGSHITTTAIKGPVSSSVSQAGTLIHALPSCWCKPMTEAVLQNPVPESLPQERLQGCKKVTKFGDPDW